MFPDGLPLDFPQEMDIEKEQGEEEPQQMIVEEESDAEEPPKVTPPRSPKGKGPEVDPPTVPDEEEKPPIWIPKDSETPDETISEMESDC